MVKNKIQNTGDKLFHENQELSKRVSELEETLNAIRSGEVDAIIVSGVEGEKLYSLNSVETLYRVIIEEMNQGVITITNDGIIVYCNNKFAKLISEPMENIIGSYFVRFLPESEVQKFRELLISCYTEKNSGELTFLKKNGHSLNLILSLNALPSEILNGVCILFSDITELKQKENELINFNTRLDQIVTEKTSELIKINSELKASHASVLSVMEDMAKTKDALSFANTNLLQEIGEHEKAEQELGESEEQYRSLFENMINGLAYCQLLFEDGKPFDFIYLKVNAAFESITGFKNITGKKVSEIIPGFRDSDGNVIEIYGRVAMTGKPESFEIFIQSLNQWYLISAYSQKIGFFIAIFDVITERKSSELQIRQLNEELEQKVLKRTEQLHNSNKELEAFSYSISHDLRAPLRAVNGYTNILLEEYEDKLDDEAKRLCRIISSSAIKMSGLIDDLLNFSRIGRTSVKSGLLDMNSLVDSVLCDSPVAEKIYTIKYVTGKLHRSFGDANLIKLVWNNLIYNAIKYSSKERTPEIAIGSKNEGNMINYFIKDNGVGFDMQYINKLFGVFQRLHSETEFEGNGVGLAIVQRIVSKHGGRVWAEGEVGKGATFWFCLPASGG